MKNKMFIFVIVLIALIMFQAKVIMPFVQDIASSDLFLEDSGDEANRVSSLNLMTESAFKQCNTHIATDILEDTALTFPLQPINAFSLGNFEYVINADLKVTPEDTASFSRRYVCRIKYLNGNDTSDILNTDNWSIHATSGLDDI